MQNKIVVFFSLILSTLIFTSCNDSPTDIGNELLNQDNVEVLKFDSSVDSVYQSSTYFKKIISLTSADLILLGKAQNVTSHLMLQFVFATTDTLRQDIKENKINVLDSYVELVKEYSFGSSNGTFDYKAFKINNKWSSFTFTADSFATLSYNNTDLSSSHSISPNDSVYSFHLAPSIVTDWLKNNVDTLLGTNNGILVSPTSNTQKVLGFTGYKVNAINDARLKVVIQKPGVYTDTLTGFISSDLSVVIGDKPSVSSENFAVQSSLAAEAKLFFSLSALPANSTINSATLTLTLDSLETKTGSDYEDALLVYLLKDSTTKEINTNYVYKLSRSGNTYTGLITNIVRAINNNVSNQGLLIKPLNELRGLEIFALKGSNAADKTKRPKLEIVYSRKK